MAKLTLKQFFLVDKTTKSPRNRHYRLDLYEVDQTTGDLIEKPSSPEATDTVVRLPVTVSKTNFEANAFHTFNVRMLKPSTLYQCKLLRILNEKSGISKELVSIYAKTSDQFTTIKEDEPEIQAQVPVLVTPISKRGIHGLKHEGVSESGLKISWKLDDISVTKIKIILKCLEEVIFEKYLTTIEEEDGLLVDKIPEEVAFTELFDRGLKCAFLRIIFSNSQRRDKPICFRLNIVLRFFIHYTSKKLNTPHENANIF